VPIIHYSALFRTLAPAHAILGFGFRGVPLCPPRAGSALAVHNISSALLLIPVSSPDWLFVTLNSHSLISFLLYCSTLPAGVSCAQCQLFHASTFSQDSEEEEEAVESDLGSGTESESEASSSVRAAKRSSKVSQTGKEDEDFVPDRGATVTRRRRSTREVSRAHLRGMVPLDAMAEELGPEEQ
jgi:hypothetical protein